ncbi:MAG: hypothetical protein WDW38_004054 [Sanguina aurantia]
MALNQQSPPHLTDPCLCHTPSQYLMSYLTNDVGAVFGFPIALTLWHMVVSSALATALVWSGVVKGVEISREVYMTYVLPISACYALSLVLSNMAYQMTSVSFIQMVKAGLPVLVYTFGILLGTEVYNRSLVIDIAIIATGVMISAWGEAHLVMFGLVCILLAIMGDAVRLTLSQKLLQQASIKFNPITTLYYLAPTSALFLTVPFALLEMRGATTYLADCSNLWQFGLNGLAAFALNVVVFLVVGRMSALSLNIAGLIKDIGTISLSVLLFGSELRPIQIVGYSIAFGGVLWYQDIRRTALPIGSPPAILPNQLSSSKSLTSLHSAEEAEGVKGTELLLSHGHEGPSKKRSTAL